jgi:hypothetical protein
MRQKRFCRRRRPYQTHQNVDLAPFCMRIHDGEPLRRVARASNICRSSLQRIYKRWKVLNYPQPFYLKETRGRKLFLQPIEEQYLASICDHYINQGYILLNKHVRKFATMIAESTHYYNTRR